MARYSNGTVAGFSGFIGLWLLLWWPLLGDGEVLFANDILFYWVPVKAYWLERVSAGEIPWWIPFISLGMPYFADVGNQTLYPGNVVFLLTNSVLEGVSWFAAIHSLLAMFTMSRLLRVLGLDAFACCFGAAVFALSGVAVSTTANLTYMPAFVWVPFGLACLAGRYFGARVTGLSLAAAMLVLAGDPLNAGVLLFAACLWPFLDHSCSLSFRHLAVPVSSILMVAILTAVQWVPTLALLEFADTKLPTAEVLQWSFPPQRLIEFVQPNFYQTAPGFNTAIVSDLYPVVGAPWFRSAYVGLIPVLLALLALSRRQGLFWAVLLVITLALSFGRWLPGLESLVDSFALFRSQRYPEKLLFWTTLCLVVLAAQGIRTFPTWPKFMEQPGPRTVATGVLVIVVVFALGHWPIQKFLPAADVDVSEYWSVHLPGSLSHGQGLAVHTLAVAALLIAGIWITSRWRRSWFALLCILAVADLAWIQREQVPFAPREAVQPDTDPVVHLALQDLGYHGDSAVLFDINNTVPFIPDSLLKQVGQSLPSGTRDSSVLYTSLARLTRERMMPNIGSVFGVRQLGGGLVRLQPVKLTRETTISAVAENSGVRFVVTPLDPKHSMWNRRGDVERYRDESYSFKVLELARTAPRFAWEDPRNGGPGLCALANSASEQCPSVQGISVRTQAPERIVLNVRAPSKDMQGTNSPQQSIDDSHNRAVLHIAQTYHPGWKATLDGLQVPIKRTEFGLVAIEVDRGEHELILTYRPSNINIAALISLLGLLVLITGPLIAKCGRSKAD